MRGYSAPQAWRGSHSQALEGGRDCPQGGLPSSGSSWSQVCLPRAVGWDGSCHLGLGKLPAHRNAVCGAGRELRHGAACTAHSKVNTLRRRPRLQQLLTAQALPSPGAQVTWSDTCRVGTTQSSWSPHPWPPEPAQQEAGPWAAGCRREGRGWALPPPPMEDAAEVECSDVPRERTDFVVGCFSSVIMFSQRVGAFPPTAAKDQEARTGSSRVVHVPVLLSTVLRRVVPRAPRSPGPAPPSHTREMRAVSPLVTRSPSRGLLDRQPPGQLLDSSEERRPAVDALTAMSQHHNHQVPMRLGHLSARVPTPLGPWQQPAGTFADRLMLPVDMPGRGSGEQLLCKAALWPRTLVSTRSMVCGFGQHRRKHT